MGRKSSCPPEQPAPTPESPAGNPAAPGPDLSGVLGILPNISISGDAGAIVSEAGISAILPVGISLITNEASSGGLDIELSPIEVTTPAAGIIGGGECGRPLLSLDSETEATIQVPLFGEDGVLSGGTNLGDVIGGDGDGQPLLSLDSKTDATIQVPLFGEDSILGGGGDVGSLLNAAMLDVGNGGPLGAISGGEAYDGNVPLVGDLGSALGSTLDLLTTTSSLFDVPALDILGCDGVDS